MALLKRLYDKLHLTINISKSAVASAFGRKFLGYELWLARKDEIKRAISYKAQATFKQRIRELTRRSCGRSMTELIVPLRRYLLGWKAYFGLAQTPRVWRELDEWIRHRLRAIQLKHWKRGTTMHRELLALGASAKVARLVAANSHRWWRNSRFALNNVLTIAYFDRLGMPRLS
ncbi:Group II intron, maturase-specific domain [Collimonas sp. OK607]|nr:Group II intron, maturase-specific domain [Collimonas sp. OK607]